MPSFKPKANKKISVCDKASTTLDSKHQEKMDEFAEIEANVIPSLEAELKSLEESAANENLKSYEVADINYKIDKIRKQIRDLGKKKNQYLLDNSHIIFDYFEKKKDMSEGIGKVKVLHSFFAKGTTKPLGSLDGATDVKKYLSNIDEKFLNMEDYKLNHEVCQHCHGELIPVDHEGVMVCKSCGRQITFLIEHEKPSYKEPPKEVCFYAYKRINHFREILAQFQAKETTQIPPEVLKNIKLQIKKERISLKQMTNKKAKDILKKLGYNKYYEHIPFIKDKLGIKPPIMSQELEETLCSLFMDIQKPYAKHCPDDRVNFLNYYYVLYKMCELLGETQFLPYFPMLKDPVKRIEQDEIWKKICAELQWEFVQTI